MITVEGELKVGLLVDGVCHRHFVMREASIKDAIRAAEKVADTLVGDEAVSGLISKIYKAAEQLVSIGEITVITAEMLLALPDADIFPLTDAQDELEKKQLAARSSCGPIEASS